MKPYFLSFVLTWVVLCQAFSQVPGRTSRILFQLKGDIKEENKTCRTLSSTSSQAINNLNRMHQAVRISAHPAGSATRKCFYVVEFPDGTNIQELIRDYYGTGEIEYAEPDYVGTGGESIVPNDFYYGRQWPLKNNGTFSGYPSVPGADLKMEDAWGISQGDSNVIVGIIDSGVKMDHPEFAGRIWRNYKEIAENNTDDDQNGYINDVFGWDFVTPDNYPSDDRGHGTCVAGIAGSNSNNAIGFAGVDWKCKLMILKVLNSSNYGYFSWWADGIYYATDNGARVINLSMGGPEYSLTLETATAYAYSKGVVVVASMGNNKTSIPAYPAAFPGIIAVGSTDPDDARTQAFLGNPNYGSSFGQHISVVAPGNYVPGLNFQSDTDYSMLWGGTSMAAPHVAGLASLLVALKPSYRPSQIRSIIESTAEDLVGSPVEDTPGWDQYYGYGRINAYRALSQALGITEPAYSQGQFSVYPNPACGDFTVSFPPGTKQIVLLDPSGRIISTTQVTGERTHLFRGVKAGFYLIRLTGEQAPCTLVLIAS